MEIEINKINDVSIAEIISDRIEITNTQDALDIMANCNYQGSSKIILHEKNIIPDFFDLKTGLADDILQKFTNYNIKVAIIGDFSKYKSKNFKDFLYESNKHGRINFVSSIEEAKVSLLK